jgi:hypothetical protein
MGIVLRCRPLPYAAFAENSRGKFPGKSAAGNQFFSMKRHSGCGCEETWV